MEPLLGGSIGHRASLEGGRTAADIAMSAAEAAAAEAAADDPGKAPFLARVPWAKVGRQRGLVVPPVSVLQPGKCPSTSPVHASICCGRHASAWLTGMLSRRLLTGRLLDHPGGCTGGAVGGFPCAAARQGAAQPLQLGLCGCCGGAGAPVGYSRSCLCGVSGRCCKPAAKAMGHYMPACTRLTDVTSSVSGKLAHRPGGRSSLCHLRRA